jgi:hypothetical protein
VEGGADVAGIVAPKDNDANVTYTPKAIGDHLVNVTLNDLPIKDSPFKVPVTLVTEHNGVFYHFTGDGLRKAETGKLASFRFAPKNKAGDTVVLLPKDVKFSLTVTPKPLLHTEIVPLDKDGVHEVPERIIFFPALIDVD